jgi:ABC-type sugar transport system permease subunit
MTASTETGVRTSPRIRGGDRPGAWPYLLILPGFVFYAAFVLFPIGETVRL